MLLPFGVCAYGLSLIWFSQCKLPRLFDGFMCWIKRCRKISRDGKFQVNFKLCCRLWCRPTKYQSNIRTCNMFIYYFIYEFHHAHLHRFSSALRAIGVQCFGLVLCKMISFDDKMEHPMQTVDTYVCTNKHITSTKCSCERTNERTDSYAQTKSRFGMCLFIIITQRILEKMERSIDSSLFIHWNTIFGSGGNVGGRLRRLCFHTLCISFSTSTEPNRTECTASWRFSELFIAQRAIVVHLKKLIANWTFSKIKCRYKNNDE